MENKQAICEVWGVGWQSPIYTRNEIKRAGKIIRNSSDIDSEEYQEALRIVDNWRASHAYPLQVIYMNFYRKYSSKYIVAQRLKRLDSIVGKLKRDAGAGLWTMQDLGGCRVIVDDISNVYDVVNEFKSSGIHHIAMGDKDYIKNPKTSGYRCYHMAYQYHSDKKKEYNKNIRIEIQVRTHLQHIWATAVETMGYVLNQGLKSSAGDKDALRFFALASSLFAIREGTPLVPNTPNTKEEIASELKELDEAHGYLNKLLTVSVVNNNIHTDEFKPSDYVVLVRQDSIIAIYRFKWSDSVEATEFYAKLEKKEDGKDVDALLAKVSSLRQLKAAYPNYFGDTNEFVGLIKEAIDEIA